MKKKVSYHLNGLFTNGNKRKKYICLFIVDEDYYRSVDWSGKDVTIIEYVYTA